MGTKSRSSSHLITGTYWTGTGPEPGSPNRSFVDRKESQETYSTSNPAWHAKNRPPNVGGPFWTRRQVVTQNPAVLNMMAGTNLSRLRYHGPLMVRNLDYAPLAFADGADWGPEAYDRMRPAKPKFESLNAIYELRELPILLRQRFLDSGLAGISKYWLALQFGWRPLFNDIANLVRTQIELEKYLEQLFRDNGRPVRRNVTLRELSEVSSDANWIEDWSIVEPVLNSRFHEYAHSRKSITRTTDRVWASAQFRYWLPGNPSGVRYSRALKAAVYGLRTPTPAMIWRSMPWTWLIDWFTTAGHVLANSETGIAERVAADYFYVMRERSIQRTTFVRGRYKPYPVNAWRTFNLSGSVETRHKTRLKGNPFSLNWSQGDLSPMQWSILGALGHSHV